jgi:hypothetical protein
VVVQGIQRDVRCELRDSREDVWRVLFPALLTKSDER